MRKAYGVLAVALVFGGCAPRYTIRQVQNYDAALSIAEKRGMEVSKQRAKLEKMLVSYFENPKEEPGKFNTGLMMTMPIPGAQAQGMPLSPMEYQRAVTGR